MRTHWRLKDLIDLEYFFQMDRNLASDEIDRRDRNLFINHLQPLALTENQRPTIILRWLQQRQKRERQSSGGNAILPGDAFTEVYRLCCWILVLAGFFVGISLTFSLLSYKGTEPLNVAIYFGVFVGAQLGLLIIAALMTPLHLRKKAALKNSMIYSILSGLLLKFTLKLKASALSKLSQAQQNHLQAALGLARKQKAIYGSLFFWPVFIMAQLCAVAFNIGILSATLIRVLGSDLAFGWQSTLQISSQAVYGIVKSISLPWRWWIPSPVAHPTLEQIEGSKLILKDGMYHLMTQDLVSWWPFLILAVLFYGLLPRIILLTGSLWIRNRKLRQLPFDTAECDKLMARLTTPLVSAQARRPQRPAEPDIIQMPRAVEFPPKQASVKTKHLWPADAITALIPDDIFDRCPKETLRALIFSKLGYTLAQATRMEGDWISDGPILEEMARVRWEDDRPKVLMLQEAWQPPIKETLIYIRELRKKLGHKAKIILLLIGMPTNETIFTPVNEQNWMVWQQKIDQFADPYLRLEKWESRHEL